MSKTHIMVDLETLGTTPGCSIMSIGAVVFDPRLGTLGPEFYTVISRQSCADAFLFEEEGTIKFWERQPPEAKKILDEVALDTAASLGEALSFFASWLKAQDTDGRQVRLWGNGADFDNAILSSAYAAIKQKMPATFGGRCYRTIKNLEELFAFEPFPKLERVGTYHNALDDAKSQALHMQAIIRHIVDTTG